jgi:hypothetical protein
MVRVVGVEQRQDGAWAGLAGMPVDRQSIRNPNVDVHPSWRSRSLADER